MKRSKSYTFFASNYSIVNLQISYTLSHSGRSHLYRDEVVKSVKELKESRSDKNDSNLNKDVNGFYIPQNSIAHEIKQNKRPIILGVDSEGSNYYSLLCNQDCRIYKEKKNKELKIDFSVIVKNYDELEKLMAKLESSRNSNDINLLKK